MSAVVRMSLIGLVRAPARTLVRVVVLAIAAGLLGAMILFVGNSLRTMTAGAVGSVPVDWQSPVASYRAALRAAAAVSRQPDVLAALPVATAPFAGAEHTTAAGTIRSGTGAILAVPPGYAARFRTLRLLRGSFRPGQIVFDQQLAATLQAQPGDWVTLTPRSGGHPRHFRVSGVLLATAADVLFQPLDPLLGPAAAPQPPANIAILPLDTFASRIAPALGSATAAAGVPSAPAGVQWQVQAQVRPDVLTGSPSQALARAGQIRNRVERSLPGQVRFVDNLESALGSAAGDALYAETLFIMLAAPGALIALGLAYLAALGTVERDRRDLALLRIRGATRRHLLVLASTESLAIGLVTGAVGTVLALLVVWLAVPGGLGSGIVPVLVALASCVAVAVLGAAAARFGGSLGGIQRGVFEGRRTVRRPAIPLWQRLYLDWVALAVSGLIYWLTARTGFSAVVNPDSNPTLSLSVYMFFAPALLWIGAALLVLRLRGRLLVWVLRRVVGGRARSWPGFLLASASRRGGALNRGLLVVGLLLAFGVALSVFSATYDQQARIDAQLTLGADVVVSAAPGVVSTHALERRISSLAGVSGATAVEHTYAYVGPDLQDTFGIDASTIVRGTTLRDSYFVGGSASTTLARLRAVPDGILVSKETITDYSLRPGDLLRLRVLDRSRGAFRIVPFHVVGIVQEFPAAPRDSFMVANRAYLDRVTHASGPNLVFVKAGAEPVALGRLIAARTRTFGATVRDIRHQTAQTVSSITTVDLTGISRIEETFVIALAAAAMVLLVSVGVAERRQELATLAALGASLRRVCTFVWSEIALVLAASLALASLLGWLMAEMLVAMLQHVFDPPPDRLAVPWAFLGGLTGAALAGLFLAVGVALVVIRRLPLGAVLREE